MYVAANATTGHLARTPGNEPCRHEKNRVWVSGECTGNPASSDNSSLGRFCAICACRGSVGGDGQEFGATPGVHPKASERLWWKPIAFQRVLRRPGSFFSA